MLVYCNAPLTSNPVTTAPTVVLSDRIARAASASADKYRFVVRGSCTAELLPPSVLEPDIDPDNLPYDDDVFMWGAVAMNVNSSRGRWYGRSR